MSPTTTRSNSFKVVETTLNHYLAPELGGHTEFYTATAGYFRRKFDERQVKIQDIRGRQNKFDLDTQGFQLHEAQTVGGDFQDPEKIKREVYPETEKLLKDVTGATRVHVFSHFIRDDDRDEAERRAQQDPDLAADDAFLEASTPARFIHVDHSERGGVQVVKDNLHPPELVEQLLKTRWAIINVWRPIKPVSKDPVAICDWRTVREQDLVPIFSYLPSYESGSSYAMISKGTHFEELYLKHRPDQEWYYADGMKPGECLLIKNFDSIKDGKTARWVPHTAFVDPTNLHGEKRESIEFRCLVFFEDQPFAE